MTDPWTDSDALIIESAARKHVFVPGGGPCYFCGAFQPAPSEYCADQTPDQQFCSSPEGDQE